MSKKLKWQDPTVPEKLKPFRNIQIGDILLDDPKTEIPLGQLYVFDGDLKCLGEY